MLNSIDEAAIRQFYDRLFDGASIIVKRGNPHAPMLMVLNRSREMTVMLLSLLTEAQQTEIHTAIASTPQVLAACLIVQARVACVGQMDTEENRKATLEKLASASRVDMYPDTQDALLFSFLASTRRAVLMCPIDRKTNSVTKAPFKWSDDRTADKLIIYPQGDTSPQPKVH